jgi:heat-inducible transcriptional repressor
MLNDRNQRVLKAVVRCYIKRAEPVGSRFVTKKYAFNLSPATIRNIMADLEEMGYLVQPHTSAGRVPTDMGYRFYVDSLRTEGRPADDSFAHALKRRIEAIRSDMNRLLEEAIRAVSEMSKSLVFAVPLRPEGTTLNRIQLYRYRNSQTVAVIFSDEGLVTTKIVDADFGLSQRDLDRISDYLNAEFYGCTMDEIRAGLLRQISKERRRCDVLISKAVEICREALTFSRGDLIVSGVSELLGLPEFSDRINDIAGAIENKHRIVRLLDKLSESDGVKVVIGSENPDSGMRDISIITADYKQGDRPLGSVGIIGPTRMDYSKTIPLVDMMARSISASMER